MAPENSSQFFYNEIDYPELRKTVSNIIESIAQSPQEGKEKLLKALLEQVEGMNLKDLGLAINYQGLQKEVNKELFIKFIEEALGKLTSEDVNSKIIEEALKYVDNQAISNVINNNKGPLDNLVNYFKSASANEKIGIASAGIVLGVAFSPLIVLATLIALVVIGARYVGIGIVKAGEKVKEGAIEAGKAVKSSYKDLIDKLPEFKQRENNFSRLNTNVLTSIANISRKNNEGIKVEGDLGNRRKILEMLQNEEQRSAIKELIKDGTIKGFSEEYMSRLINKGLRTYENDMKALEELMEKFQPAIMAIGNGEIDEVEKMVNKKASEMKPSSQVGSLSNLEQASTSKGKITPSGSVK